MISNPPYRPGAQPEASLRNLCFPEHNECLAPLVLRNEGDVATGSFEVLISRRS